MKAEVQCERRPSLIPPEDLADLAIMAGRSGGTKGPPVDIEKTREEHRIVTGVHEACGAIHRQLEFGGLLPSRRKGSADEVLRQMVVSLLYLDCDAAFPSPTLTKADDGAVHGVNTSWFDHAESKLVPPLFIVSNSCMRPARTANSREERMNTSSHPEIIGLDVPRDWLDLHCPADNLQLRLPNADDGYSELAKIVGDRNPSAAAPSDADQGVWKKQGNFGQDGSDRRRIDRLLHGVPPEGRTPIARDSGRMRGKRMIGGGRRALRQVLYQAALVALNHNKDLKVFADRLRKEEKPHKVVAAAVARKLVVIVNALRKSR